MSSVQEITPELRQWIVDQAASGHGVDAILDAMKASGWQEDVAVIAIDQTLAAEVERRNQQQRLMPEVTGPSDASSVWAYDKHVKILLRLKQPRIAVLGDFLAKEECEALIRESSARLTRSETVQTSTGGSEVNEARTSQGMFFGRGESELCRRIEARIAALVNWPEDHGEGIQILRYAPGAEYRAHYDYFDPTQPGTSAILRRGGQRVGTVVMYLNTPEQGGATTFPDIGLDVHAIQGNAVFFAYAVPSPDTLTLHGGAPVVRGEKWVATKWLRERRFE
ncbi:MAG TPA: 2OG-Fe(II) oxygenase [Aquabacterium sp.]|nr:2OG-Fe(II) oxygenase [Aquabacterium sp.]